MITAQTWKNGAVNGLSTSYMLLKIIIPVYALVTILNHTPVIGWVARYFEPAMNLGRPARGGGHRLYPPGP